VNEPTSYIPSTTRPFTFAVIGDLHFGLASSGTDLALDAVLQDPSIVERFVDNVEYALEPMAEALRQEDLSFVVQTGDLTARGRNPLELRAATRFLRGLDCPVLVARGDKDEGELFDEIVLPLLARNLGRESVPRFYTAEIGGCHFVFLDTSTWDPDGDQAEWLEIALDRADRQGGHVFVFGHHPVWTLNKAFYSNRAFSQSVLSILHRHRVDAYFCGHTHNQSILHHRSGQRPCLQFMGAPIGHPDELPTPLDRVQSLLVNPNDVIDCWPGYLENTAPGWYLVNVGVGSVEVSWHHLNRGSEAEVIWDDTGHIERFWFVRHPEDAVMINRDLKALRRLTLRYCAWDGIRPGKRVRLNGTDVGELPPSAQFAPKQVDLPMAAISALDMINRIEIEAPGVEAATIGNLQLEGVLPGGRIVRTRPTGEVFTWSDRWDPWKLPRLEKVMPGRPLRTMLSFQ
jgi:predicted phosphodiesterase